MQSNFEIRRADRVDEANAPRDGWDDPVRGRIRWRTLFSRGLTPSEGMTCGVAELRAGRLARSASARAAGNLLCVRRRRGREPRREGDRGQGGRAVFIPGMAEHGIRQTGSGVLRLFYAFPVDSFDSVEYLFSGA